MMFFIPIERTGTVRAVRVYTMDHSEGHFVDWYAERGSLYQIDFLLEKNCQQWLII
jgi:hypothetical protein